MFSRIRIGCQNSFRNLYDYTIKQTTSNRYICDLVKRGRYDKYLSKIKKDNFSCEDFIPMSKLDFVVVQCPVDFKSIPVDIGPVDIGKRFDEHERAKRKIDYVIGRCANYSYNFSLSEIAISKDITLRSLIIAIVFSYVFEYILQMNQDIDILLSSDSTDYVCLKLYDVIKEYLNIFNKFNKIDYIKKLIYEIFSKDCLRFVTTDNWNKVQNIHACYVEDDILNIMFEMPKTVY